MLGLDTSYLNHDMDGFKARLYIDDREKIFEKIDQCLRNNEDYFSTHRMVKANGDVIWVEDRGKVVKRDKQGNALRMVGSAIDITERRKAEERMLLTQYAVDHAADGAFWINVETSKFEYVNESICRMSGFDEKELMQKQLSEIDSNFPKSEWETQVKNLRSDPYLQCETEHKRKDGALTLLS